MYRIALLTLALLTLPMIATAQPAADTAKLSSELIGLAPGNLQIPLQSRTMTVVTSSFTATNPTTGRILATVTVPAGKVGYILGYKVGSTVQGRFDIYKSATNAYNTAYVGDYGDSGYVMMPNWQSMSATAGTTLSVRVPTPITGVVNATIVVGESNANDR